MAHSCLPDHVESIALKDRNIQMRYVPGEGTLQDVARRSLLVLRSARKGRVLYLNFEIWSWE